MADLKAELTARLNEDFLPAFNKGMKHIDMFCDGCAILPMGKETVNGKEEIGKSLELVEDKLSPRIQELEVVEVEQMGDDHAISQVKLNTTYKDGSTAWTKGLTVWKKVDGKWYFYRDMYNRCE